MLLDEDNYLLHFGTLRKSGRYPWGSGDSQSARNATFLDTVNELRKTGMSDVDIAKSFSTPEQRFTTSDLRALKTIAINAQKQEQISTAQKLANKGLSNIAIGEKMGINESSVRNLRAPGAADKANILNNTTEMLRREVEDKQYLDVGTQSAAHLGINDTYLKTALINLREDGYRVHYVKIPQLGTGQFTTSKVLTKPDVPYAEVYKNRDNIRLIQEHTDDGGRSGYFGLQPPIQINSKRIGINYKEDGGAEADGVIYVRPGVHDLGMGGNQYSQVRIAVDGTHFIKGMAVYKEGLPKGVDLQFNTNKSNTGNKLDALKPLKEDREGNIDQDNPFGAVVRQLPKYDKNGVEIKNTVASAMNLVNTDSDWERWSKSLSSQFLSKQSPTLAQEQLNMTYERKRNELNELKTLTNPAVKRKLLQSFADDADSSAVHLKAQALPKQRAQVIMPVKSLKDNEIYAPNFLNGERVVLIRHPHGGTFEIPELTVNNKNQEGQALLGKQAKAAVGINATVASRLSGADFDGDTVLVIPNNQGRVQKQRPLEGLKNFDPQAEYKAYEGMPKMTPSYKQNQMGAISNLITDMTIKGANNTELAAAVRHSMVVIDAEKHNLDYRRSARENGIPALVKKYQPATAEKATAGGSSTLISRAKSSVSVPERKQGYRINPVTGRKEFTETGRSYVNAKGETVYPVTKSTKLGEATDARALSSGTRIEQVYAIHANKLKAIGDEARLELLRTQSRPQNKSAKTTYASQVKTLDAQLALAELNAPRERQAQVVANKIVATKKAAYPELSTQEGKADLKKIKGQALAEARIRTGASKTRIVIDDEEWAAIQAGAISNNKLKRIINNADLDRLKELATPRTATIVSSAMASRGRGMLADGYTQAEVAVQLGISLSTLKATIVE